MKLIFSTLLLTLSLNTLAAGQRDWYENIPGRNYSWRDLQYQRAILNNQRKLMNKDEELKGTGIDFTGVVEVATNTEVTPPTKTYKVYIRGCGKVDLPEKDQAEMDKLTTGTSVRLKFSGGRDCKVQDWSKN